MRAVSLAAVLVLAKCLGLAGRDLPVSIWLPSAVLWQDVTVGVGQRLFDEMGCVGPTQQFYRYYMLPNATQCGGAGMTESVLLNALTNWVEKGVKHDHILTQDNPTRTPKFSK